MSTPPASLRAAPPPFSAQRAHSRAVFGGLVLAVVGVVLAGAFVTVPTHVTTTATVVEPPRCASRGAPVGPSGCLLVPLGPSLAERAGPHPGGRLVPVDGPSVPLELSRTADGPDGPVLAAALGEPTAPGPATAVVDVGDRRLALVFLGRGLEAGP